MHTCHFPARGNGTYFFQFCFGGKGKWHLGKCLNAAILESKGDLIVIPDGDIVVEENFLEEVLLFRIQGQKITKRAYGAEHIDFQVLC